VNLKIAAWSVPPVRQYGLGYLNGEHEDRRVDETSGHTSTHVNGHQEACGMSSQGERSSANEELRPRQEAGYSPELQARLRQDRMDDLRKSHG